MKEVFSVHGYPEKLTSDNGPHFTSKQFDSYLKECNIVHHLTTPYWPQANGLIERYNRTFLKAIRSVMVEKGNWKEGLTLFLMAYRSTPHTTTGLTPSFALNKREMRTKLPVLEEKDVGEGNLASKMKDKDAKKEGRVKKICR